MRTALANWIAALPESVLLGGMIFGVCTIALALSVGVVWVRNRRRLVPRPYTMADYARASAFLLLLPFIMAVVAGIAWAVFIAARNPGHGG